jgi:pantoate kinase
MRRPAASTVEAFAPSAITNFFTITYDSLPEPLGATGGGYILSKGTVTKAAYNPGGGLRLDTKVDGDVAYNARTTRRAVNLLLSASDVREGRLSLEQTVETPIGGGFGASAAAATSAVIATSAVVGIHGPKKELALFAHRAEILEQTGLGTVSVIFDAVGAGAITVPGEPGKAEFVNVPVPRDLRIVTAFIAPYDKKDALSSKTLITRINSLGLSALERFLSDPCLDVLAEEGDRFSKGLGLESPEVKKLIATAKRAGAMHASQNMIGYSIHSLVDSDRAEKVADALRGVNKGVRVDVFEVGWQKAGVLGLSRRPKGPS